LIINVLMKTKTSRIKHIFQKKVVSLEPNSFTRLA
jgi:hypothetical protein